MRNSEDFSFFVVGKPVGWLLVAFQTSRGFPNGKLLIMVLDIFGIATGTTISDV
jgi:hypothetical protein